MKSVFGFRVRLGNPDLDFENLNPDFPIERTLYKHFVRSIRATRAHEHFKLCAHLLSIYEYLVNLSISVVVFRAYARFFFALLVLIRPHYTIWEPAQAK